jgi:hypothetical protein
VVHIMTISLADGGNCCPWVIVARLTKSCQEFTGDFRHNSNSSLPFALTLFTMMMTFFFPPLNWQRVAVLLSRFFSTSCLCEKKLFYDFIFCFSLQLGEWKKVCFPPSRHPCRHSQFPSESQSRSVTREKGNIWPARLVNNTGLNSLNFGNW